MLAEVAWQRHDKSRANKYGFIYLINYLKWNFTASNTSLRAHFNSQRSFVNFTFDVGQENP